MPDRSTDAAPAEPSTTEAPTPTEAPTAAASSAAGGIDAAAEGGADLARRRFFRRFASDVIQTAATVAGAAAALQRSSAEAASAILDPQTGLLNAGGSGFGIARVVDGGPVGFRTPFRFGSPEVLMLIDQRRLPAELVEFEIRSAPEAIWAIREMIVRGAPAIGQVAAIGLALTAAPRQRHAAVRAAGDDPRRGQRPDRGAADGDQPALGGRSRDGPLRGGRRPLR